MSNFRKYPDRVLVDKDGSDLSSTASTALKIEPVDAAGVSTASTAAAAQKVTLVGAAGSTGIQGIIKTVQQTIALAASAAYITNDVLSVGATAGVSWLWAAIARADGASGYITKAVIQSESESVTPRLTLHLSNVASTTANLNDKVANTAPDAADKVSYVGAIDFPALESLGTTDSVAACSPSTVGNLPLAFNCASGADDLYGILVARDGFTQTAGEDMTITLVTES